MSQQIQSQIEQITLQRYRELIQGGAIVVQDWYGTVHLQQILNQFASATGARARFFIVDAPLQILAQAADGWNAESLADGTFIFNYDLLNASWSIAEGYACWRADPSFNLNYHFWLIAQALRSDFDIMPPTDIFGQLQYQTSQVFRDMIAFVAAHELAHFIKHDLARKLVEASLTGSTPISAMFFSRGLEIEADLLGLSLLVQAGYDPRGALLSLAFMDYLDKFTGRQPHPLDPHPPASDRFTIVQQWLTNNGFPLPQIFERIHI
jgi:hypothetical protein